MAQQRPEKIRYDAEAIEFMDNVWDRFYDLWLELATQHALDDNRTKVSKPDAQVTLQSSLETLVKRESL